MQAVMRRRLSLFKWVFLGVSVVSVAVAVFYAAIATHKLDEIMRAVALQLGTTIANPDISSYEGETLVWRLRAESAVEHEDQVILQQPNIDMYLHNSEHMPAQADQGVYDKKAKHMQLSGDVKTQYQTWNLDSQTLSFYEDQDEVRIDDAFKLMQDGVLIEGKHMKISRQDGRIQVFRGVQMTLEQAE